VLHVVDGPAGARHDLEQRRQREPEAAPAEAAQSSHRVGVVPLVVPSAAVSLHLNLNLDLVAGPIVRVEKEVVADAGDFPHEPPGRLEVVEQPGAEDRVEAAMLREVDGLEIFVLELEVSAAEKRRDRATFSARPSRPRTR